MKICFELKPDEARTFYDALFRAVSVDDVDVFDSSVCPDEPIREEFSDEFDPERDDDVHQYQLSFDPIDDDFDDDDPLYYVQEVIHFGTYPVVLSLSLLRDHRLHFCAYDATDDCNIQDFCCESVHDFLPAVRAAAWYDTAVRLHQGVCDYIRNERCGVA